MIDLFSTLQFVLREAGFVTRPTSDDGRPTLNFEDDTLMGFGCVFDDPTSLITHWKPVETSLLMRHASSFRAAGEKAWNVYTVLLCASAADDSAAREVRWIEENLERTRKIAACGVSSRDDLVGALLPILPLQYRPLLQIEDVTQRLQKRIHDIAPKAADVVLDEKVPAIEVVRLLGVAT